MTNVEFIGLGGVGKTTFINENKFKFSQIQNVNIYEGTNKFKKRHVRFSKLKLLFSLGLYNSIRFVGKGGGYKLISKIAERQLHSKHHDDKFRIMFDCGVLQPFISYYLYHGELSYNLISKILNQIQLPEIVIYVEGDSINCYRRFKMREQKIDRFSKYDSEHLKERFLEHNNFFEYFTSILEHKSVKVIRISKDNFEP